MRGNRLLAVFFLFALGATFSLGQFDTSAVLGLVRDSSGAPIAASKVTLVNLATGVALATTTDSQGNFQFPDVHIGRCRLVIGEPE